jgi:hypothetical protein
MKITEDSEKSRDFMLRQEDIPDGVPGVLIRIIEYHDRLRVMMEIDEDTTSDQISKARWLALKWRNRLLEYQGAWIQGGINEFYYLLMKRYKSGQKYPTIAKYLNQRIEYHLREYNRTADPLYLDRAKRIMQAMGLTDAVIEASCNEVIYYITQNETVIGPITRQMVEQKIRHWKDTKEYKSIKDDW